MWEALLDLDRSLFNLINQGGKNPVFDLVMPIVSGAKYFTIPLFILLAFFLLRGGPRARWAFLALVAVMALGDSLTFYVIKPFFARPRPFSVLEQMYVYKGGHWTTHVSWFSDKTMSFPSNHAVNASAAAAVLIYFFPRWWPLPAALTLIICYSRVYLGLHWPGDVLGGVMLGPALSGVFFAFQALLVRFFPERFSWLTPEAGP